MTCPANDQERLSRIADLGGVLLRLGTALERGEWIALQTHAKEAGRMARVLQAMEERKEKIESNDPPF